MSPCPRVPASTPLPQAWPAIREAARAAGVGEPCARGEALREEVELRRPPVQVLSELLDMLPAVRARFKLPPIADPDGYLRGWRKRPMPERTYGDAKRVLQHYGLSLRPDRPKGPQPVGEVFPQAAAPP